MQSLLKIVGGYKEQEKRLSSVEAEVQKLDTNIITMCELLLSFLS